MSASEREADIRKPIALIASSRPTATTATCDSGGGGGESAAPVWQHQRWSALPDWREITSETTPCNVKASVEVRELKDQLSEAELKTVSGEIAIVKWLDAAST
jgi:hypothetical protein